MVLGAVLARINLKAGRGDRAGGFRVAVFNFLVTLAAWLLSASHFAALGVEVSRVFAAIGMALFDTAVVWLTYLGLEPYLRRYSPDSILGWTTLVSGRWRDPRVGVDVLIGLAAGLGMTTLYAAHNLLPTLAGRVEPMPFEPSIDTLNGLRFIFGAIAKQLSAALTSGLLGVAGIVGFVLLFKRPIAAGLAAAVCFTPVVISGMFPGTTPLLDIAIGLGIAAIFVLTIMQGGATVGDRRALHSFHPATRANHDRLLELARRDRPLVCRTPSRVRPGRVLLREVRRGRARHDFLTLTRIGVPMSPNDSRSWLIRNRS